MRSKGRLRGGMFLISKSMSGLDFRALGNPRNSVVRDYNTSLNCKPLIGTMRPELRLLNLHFFNICRIIRPSNLNPMLLRGKFREDGVPLIPSPDLPPVANIQSSFICPSFPQNTAFQNLPIVNCCLMPGTHQRNWEISRGSVVAC